MTSYSGEFALSITLKDAAFSAHGDASTVLDAYEDFKSLLSMSPQADGGTPETESQDKASKASSSGFDGSVPHTDLPLKPFLSEHNLKGNKEKATAIVAWSGGSGNEASLAVADIEKLWKKTSFKAPKNLARDIRKAEAEGWLHRDGKAGSPDATFTLTGYGQQIVEGWKATGSS